MNFLGTFVPGPPRSLREPPVSVPGLLAQGDTSIKCSVGNHIWYEVGPGCCLRYIFGVSSDFEFFSVFGAFWFFDDFELKSRKYLENLHIF